MFIGFMVALLARGGQHTGILITCFNIHKGAVTAVSWLLMVTFHSEHSELLLRRLGA